MPSDYAVLYEMQQHNYADWGRPEWEPAVEHWGMSRHCAELEADRLNQTGRIALSPLSCRVRNAHIVECSSKYCDECQWANEWGPDPEGLKPNMWMPVVRRLMALPHVQAHYAAQGL